MPFSERGHNTVESGPAWSFGAAADDEFGGEGEVDRAGVTVSEQVE
jgi:hypothetical protein